MCSISVDLLKTKKTHMQIKHFIGIDVSKDTLDLSVVVNGKPLSHYCIGNSAKEIKSTVSRIMKEMNGSFDDTIFCMEHTGLYNLPVVKWLNKNEGKMWLESGVHIRRTLGLVRGKNDKVDSSRIAMFAYTNRHLVKLWSPPRHVIEIIAALLSQRARLIKAKKQLATANMEQRKFLDKDIMHSLNKYTNRATTVIDKQVDDIEDEIIDLIKDDDKLKRMYQIITSINGIGLVTASYILVTTNEFINISDPKKYACYSGVVPFEHTSGTSVRGRNRVSHIANKSIKTLLHLAAISTLNTPGEIQDYYNRKIAEGKNKMSIINAIRNKLILRVFACIKQNREYEKNYCYKFA
jgi:transposase